MPDHDQEGEFVTEGFSFWVTVAFTLNYILGSGFLTLPWTFQQTGVILGMIVLAVFGFFSTLSVFFILETIDRGQRLLKYMSESGIELASLQSRGGSPSYAQIRDASYHNPDEPHRITDEESIPPSPTRPKLPSEKHRRNVKHSSSPTAVPTTSSAVVHSPMAISTPAITSGTNTQDDYERGSHRVHSMVDDEQPVPAHDRKLEIVELSGMFLGSVGQQCYATIIIVYMYGTLWAYAVVFAKAFAAHLPISSSSYFLYILLFGLLVIPISLMEFKEQVSVQVSLSIFRIVMVSVMVITCLVAQYKEDDEFSIHSSSNSENISNNQADEDLLWKFRPSQMYYLLPVAAYAYIFHHSVPSLADNARDKHHLTHLFRTALVISMIAYMAVGTIVALYFGSSIETTSNLNWGNYRGAVTMSANGTTSHDIPVYASMISFFVVLFPAIDVASAYPLNAYTLGNNLMSIYYGKEMYKHESSRWKLNFFRALAAVPPIFGSLLLSKVEQITAYTGLTAFGLAFVFPPLLARYSAKTLADLGLPISTPHSSVWTSEPFQWLLFGSGLAIFITVFICLQVKPE